MFLPQCFCIHATEERALPSELDENPTHAYSFSKGKQSYLSLIFKDKQEKLFPFFFTTGVCYSSKCLEAA